MTVVFSSSSPIASVALFHGSELSGSAEEESKNQASRAILFHLERLLKESGAVLSDVHLFAADLGPGSFTGVKVAVTLAKSFGFALRRPCAGFTAFDLVDPGRVVALPSRRGEWYVRVPGETAQVSSEVPEGAIVDSMPLATNAGPLLAGVRSVDPALLVPLYVAEPSISVPKDPRVTGGKHG